MSGFSLAGSLSVAFGLVRIDFAHLFKDVVRVRFFDLGSGRTVVVSATTAAARGRSDSAIVIRHARTLNADSAKVETWLARPQPPTEPQLSLVFSPC
ncbi:MAG: hypothetical protein ACI8UO_001412 [Verrucomicrobiales bacterium]|jgi:hypothetical protein